MNIRCGTWTEEEEEEKGAYRVGGRKAAGEKGRMVGTAWNVNEMEKKEGGMGKGEEKESGPTRQEHILDARVTLATMMGTS